MVQLLCGENEFAIFDEVRKLTHEFLTGHDVYGLERLDGEEFDLNRFESSLIQLPFLVRKKLVLLKHPFATKSLIEYLYDTLERVPEEVDVLLIDAKPDKRTKLYKRLAEIRGVREFKELAQPQLVSWASEYAESMGATLSAKDAKHIVERIGSQQMLIAREIEKLAPFGNITEQDIDDLTDQSMQGTVFEILEYTFSQKKPQALAMFDEQIAAKADPLQILGLISWQLHIFALVKASIQYGNKNIVGVHPYVAGKAEKVVGDMGFDELKSKIRLALETELTLKTRAVDPVDALRVLLIEL